MRSGGLGQEAGGDGGVFGAAHENQLPGIFAGDQLDQFAPVGIRPEFGRAGAGAGIDNHPLAGVIRRDFAGSPSAGLRAGAEQVVGQVGGWFAAETADPLDLVPGTRGAASGNGEVEVAAGRLAGDADAPTGAAQPHDRPGERTVEGDRQVEPLAAQSHYQAPGGAPNGGLPAGLQVGEGRGVDCQDVVDVAAEPGEWGGAGSGGEDHGGARKAPLQVGGQGQRHSGVAEHVETDQQNRGGRLRKGPGGGFGDGLGVMTARGQQADGRVYERGDARLETPFPAPGGGEGDDRRGLSHAVPARARRGRWR